MTEDTFGILALIFALIALLASVSEEWVACSAVWALAFLCKSGQVWAMEREEKP